jgi:hypothetical protein
MPTHSSSSSLNRYRTVLIVHETLHYDRGNEYQSESRVGYRIISTDAIAKVDDRTVGEDTVGTWLMSAVPVSIEKQSVGWKDRAKGLIRSGFVSEPPVHASRSVSTPL